jgi:phosphoglycolate phosphatase
MIAPLVVFDLDGTLVDTAPDLVETLNVVFAREGLPPVEDAIARNMVGGGARVMIERGLAAEGRILPVAEVDRLVAGFIDHYSAHIADKSRLFSGVEAALDELAAHGCRFAICTNKLEWLSVRLLEALGLAERFAAICGQDTFKVAKPDPAILHATIARAGGTAATTVMVGDSITDVATARAARIPIIAVDFGYSDRPVVEFSPDSIISRFADLPKAAFEFQALGRQAFAAKS